jgi:hypothetical protein
MGRATCEIVDRAALERRTCECCGIVSAEYRHLNDRGCHHHILADARPVGGPAEILADPSVPIPKFASSRGER